MRRTSAVRQCNECHGRWMCGASANVCDVRWTPSIVSFWIKMALLQFPSGVRERHNGLMMAGEAASETVFYPTWEDSKGTRFPGSEDSYCSLLGYDTVYRGSWIPMLSNNITALFSSSYQTKRCHGSEDHNTNYHINQKINFYLDAATIKRLNKATRVRATVCMYRHLSSCLATGNWLKPSELGQIGALCVFACAVNLSARLNLTLAREVLPGRVTDWSTRQRVTGSEGGGVGRQVITCRSDMLTPSSGYPNHWVSWLFWNAGNDLPGYMASRSRGQ